jgi:hypothetical protein
MANHQLILPHTLGALASKDERHLIFAQWLIDTYGVAFLAQGCGVLDIAGGEYTVSLVVILDSGWLGSSC